jgi:transposase
MRKGFEGLYGLVRDRLQLEPLSGHVFIFCNKARNRTKILFWDGSGLWICAKRLQKGRFSWPSEDEEQVRVSLSHEELALLLGGCVGISNLVRFWNLLETTQLHSLPVGRISSAAR